MANMKKQYGGEKAERIFYATENKRKGDKKKHERSKASLKAFE